MATNFGPEIVSIAGVYRTFDQGLPAAIAGKPALVRMVAGDKGNTLTIEPLQLD
jgi:septum site-determining protein MinC